MIRLYLDEDSQDRSLLRALRARNIDAIAVQETQTEGLEGLIDVEQLRLATKQRRVLYSHNIGDFYQLHTEFIASGEKHSGIALLTQNYSVGEQVRAILEFISNKTAEEMESQLEFLSKYLRS
ncbi:hypothetical protein C7Y66_18315 [Chroococcidiopsis sp. CCALA 051]|uniref:DUF5615 family PIN-like protein n=1 Tax=Chroococcidiopsis sp. CCALA 051 TaxID=869949 RepID=UPI000D0E30F4|nr:DUF5615 family PIN-like protein [Chroococcidiopsis sp. CCALA 051]MBE9019348.1 DUF5615 family PIN-like protein [Chroococcidiopsidales cyanobacterium LEGE 13417]PSM47725.1 hypothetical protein C7Y66_18315 [Chroococcidiopsis sp. CCALA 051]